MFSLLKRTLSVSLMALSLVGSNAHGASPTKALFTTAKTASGDLVIDQLRRFDATSDAEVTQLKEVVLNTLVTAGMKSLSSLQPSQIQMGYGYGITAMSYDQEVEFNVYILPDGSVEVRHLKTPELKAAFAVFLNTQIFMAQQGFLRPTGKGDKFLFRSDKMNAILIEAIRKAVPLEIDATAYEYYITEINETGMVFFRNAKYELDFHVDANGKAGFNRDLVFGSEKSLRSRLKPADAVHVDERRLEAILADKPSELARQPRISAMYDALAVLIADDRYNVTSVKSKQLFSNKGIAPFGVIIDLAGLRDIDGGELTLTVRGGRSLTLKFDAGHFNIGTDLDKPEAWLYGKGEVGNHEGFYPQLGRN